MLPGWGLDGDGETDESVLDQLLEIDDPLSCQLPTQEFLDI